MELFWRFEAKLLSIICHGSWVSILAKRKLAESKTERQISFHRYVSHITDPQNWEYQLIVALILIFLPQSIFLFGRYSIPASMELFGVEGLGFHTVSLISNAWQVLASILGLTFVIVVFLIEVGSSRQYESSAFPIFVSYTGMVFIVIFGLTTILSLGLNVILLDNPQIDQAGLPSVTLYNLFIFCGNIGLTLFLYLRTYQFLQPRVVRNLFLESLRKQVSSSVDEELVKRISFNKVMDVCNENHIFLSMGSHSENPLYKPISINIPVGKIYEVSDVNIALLMVAAARAARLTNESSQDLIFFSSYRGRRLSVFNSELANVHINAFHPKVTNLLARSVKFSKEGVARQFRIEDAFDISENLLSDALNNNRSNTVEDVLGIYAHSLESFINTTRAYGLLFTKDTVRRGERSFEDWEVISKIVRIYINHIGQMLKASDREITRHYVGFPFSVMLLAHQFSDFLIFRRFADLYPIIYRKSFIHELDNSSRELIFDRCWRFMDEFFTYAVIPSLESEGLGASNIAVQGDYIEQIMLVLNRLLKSAIDYLDIERFNLFLSTAKGIPSGYAQSLIEDLDLMNLRTEGVPEADRDHDLQVTIRRKERINDQFRRTVRTRREMFLGLGGWLTHLVTSQRLQPDMYFQFIEGISHEFTDLQDLFFIYSGLHPESGKNDIYQWDIWELEDRPDTRGEVVFQAMQYARWIEIFFLYLCLRLCSIEPESYQQLQPFSNSDSIYESIKSLILEIPNDPTLSRIVIDPFGNEFRGRSNSLLSSMEDAARSQKLLEEDELITQELDPDIVTKFIEGVIEYWGTIGTVRQLAKHFGSYINKADLEPPVDLGAFGINQLEPKGPFVSQDRVLYLDWAKDHARGLSQWEDHSLNLILEELETHTIELEASIREVKSYIDEFRSRGLNPIIISNSLDFRKLLFTSSLFLPSWRPEFEFPDLPGLEGQFDGSPVINLRTLPEGVLIVIDMTDFAEYCQYRPDDGKQYPLLFKIKRISEEDAQEMLQTQPDLYTHPETKEVLDHDSALRRLQQRVIVQIWQKFRLENIDKAVAVVLKIENLDE